MLCNRGKAKLEDGDLDGAIADCTKAIDINPKLADPWNNRAIARIEKGDIDGAISDFTKLLELRPDLKPALEEAIQELQKKRPLP
jgi:tetratricopeptide (TPR) repeat protein